MDLFRITFPVIHVCPAGGVGINANGASPHFSAGLDIDFDDRGLLIPRLTESERDAITNPAVGLMIYNTTSKCFNVYQVSEWHQLDRPGGLRIFFTKSGHIQCE